jgi:hypothetical protein
VLPALFKREMPERNKSEGKMSFKASTRLRKAADWMVFFSDVKTVHRGQKKGKFTFRLNFITLTLSARQVHEDVYILHHMLFPFLKWLERRWKVTAWIWRAEIQEKRYYKLGDRCIHFHIVTSAFVHYKEIQEKWNQLQLAHGYRDKNTEPNSTDVHRVLEYDDMVRYMQKYITKPVKNKDLAVTCKIYGMSRNLSRMKILLAEEDINDFTDIVDEFLANNCIDKFETEHGMVYFTNLTQASKVPSYLKEILWGFKELYTKGLTSETEFYL